MNTSINYGMNTGMSEMRKITVEVPEHTLAVAQEATGAGVSEVIREALLDYASKQAQKKALALRGKIKFGVDLMALRKLED
ncbi:MAG: hypothetical protein ACTHLR_04315 [Rhizomicrobium sp.]